ncbi:hypothetical protein HY477_00895 [Candidatus Uhrbacteria bacterium]|nr:hypothetical protein [Candidatus Uhrbacteria bacterium]
MADGTPAINEDELKARLFGGANGDRSDLGYGADRDEEDTRALQGAFGAHYLQPTTEDLAGTGDDVRRMLMAETCRVVIPMGERGPVVKSVLDTLTGQMPIHNILVVSDDADDAALDEVRRHKGVRLVYRNDVLDVLDWGCLLPVLNLTERPRNKGGKGVAVLAGYLYEYLAARRSGSTPQVLLQSDAEISSFANYAYLEHLGYGLLQHPNALQVKMAKPGRTNERSMMARSMLYALAHSPRISEQARKRAADLFLGLARHKWMLAGEFALAWDVAMRRPFATGYLEETLIAMFCEDLARANRRPVVQVANQNPRLDAPNREQKEAIMQTQIGDFLLAMALEGVPTTDWGLDQIRQMNAGCMNVPLRMAWIPQDHGPVRAEVIRQNRIWPSVALLDQGGFIDNAKADQLFKAA